MRTISIVIPCANDKMLPQVLDSIRVQTYPISKIVVVLDGITSVMRNGFDVISIPTQKGKANALNQGIKSIDTDLVLCLDADTLIPTNLVEHLEKHVQEDAVVAVARVKPIKSGWVSKVRQKQYDAWFKTGHGFISGCCFLGDTAFLKAHPQDTRTMTEDISFTETVIKNNATWVYCPSAQVETKEPRSLSGLFTQILRWNYGELESDTEGHLIRKIEPRIIVGFFMLMIFVAFQAGLLWYLPIFLGMMLLSRIMGYASIINPSVELLLYSIVDTLAEGLAIILYTFHLRPKWKPSP